MVFCRYRIGATTNNYFMLHLFHMLPNHALYHKASIRDFKDPPKGAKVGPAMHLFVHHKTEQWLGRYPN